MADNEPVIVQKRGIDVTPYLHGVWCSIAGGKPFVNEIVNRRWSEDGSKIWVMFESFNFDCFGPDDMVNVVELQPTYGAPFLERTLKEDAESMAKRPAQPVVCSACGQKVAAG